MSVLVEDPQQRADVDDGVRRGALGGGHRGDATVPKLPGKVDHDVRDQIRRDLKGHHGGVEVSRRGHVRSIDVGDDHGVGTGLAQDAGNGVAEERRFHRHEDAPPFLHLQSVAPRGPAVIIKLDEEGLA